jgi:hypothetical protein
VETDHRNLVYIDESVAPKVIRWRLRLQEFDFDIIHIKGTDNVVADTLSRLTEIKLSTTEQQSTDPKSSLDHIEDVDESDFYEDSSVWPTDNPSSSHSESSSTMIVESDKSASDSEIQSDRHMENTSQPYDHILEKVHNAVVGHFGIHKTKQNLFNSGLIREIKATYKGDIRQLIHNYIQRCATCQKLSSGSKAIVAYASTARYEPFECVAIDFIGPLPKDDDGNEYISVSIDTFSKVVELMATKDTTALSAAKALLATFGRYCVPLEVQSDGGPSYVNEVIDKFLSFLSVHHRVTLPYRPQANGIVERSNKEVLRHLRSIVFDKRVKNQWSTYLPLIQRILMYSYHSTIGTYPARLLYGDAITPNRGLYTEWETKPQKLDSQDYVTNLNQQLRNIVTASQEFQKQVIAKKFEHSPDDPTTYNIGDYVLVSYPERPPDKLSTTLQGPVIVDSIQGQTYYCRDLLTDKITPYFVDRLTPFKTDSVEDAKRISLADKDEYHIDKIIDHVGDPKYKKSLLFRVRWLGYEPSDDTWEPWKHVRNTKALQTYLDSKPELKRLK